MGQINRDKPLSAWPEYVPVYCSPREASASIFGHVPILKVPFSLKFWSEHISTLPNNRERYLHRI